MVLFSTVPCSEEHAGLAEQLSLAKWDATVTLRCDYADRYNLVADIIGNQRAYPYVTNGPRAATASIVPFPSAPLAEVGQGMLYKDALVTIGYSMESKNLVSESLEPSTEFLKLDHKGFRWGAADGEPLLEAEAPGKLVRGLNLVRTLYFVPAPLPIALLTSVGHTNETAYTSALLGLTFEPETLLYGSPVVARTITTANVEASTITLKFMFKPDGWNKFWRQKTQEYSTIFVANGDEYKNYPLGNFSDFLY
jgi:hypothetical protein